MKSFKLTSTLVSLAGLFLWLGCTDSGDDTILAGGTGVESENVIVGAVEQGDAPVEGAVVRVLLEGHNPKLNKDLGPITDTTDESGHYQIKLENSGTYNLVFESPGNNHKALLQGFEFMKSDSATPVSKATLRETGALKLPIEDAAIGDYIYIPGTPYYQTVDSAALKSGALTFSGLPAAKYTSAKLTDTNDSVKSEAIADSVTVEPGETTSRIPKTIVVEDTDVGVTYSGNWIHTSNGNNTGVYLNQSAHFIKTPGAYVEYTFTGHAVEWYGLKNFDLGYANIYIDGKLEAEVDCYDLETNRRVVKLFSKTNLGQGEHTIRIEVADKKVSASSDVFVVHDYFKYWTY